MLAYDYIVTNSIQGLQTIFLMGALVLVATLVFMVLIIAVAVFVLSRLRGNVTEKNRSQNEYTLLDYKKWACAQLDGYIGSFNIDGIAKALYAKYKGASPENIDNVDFNEILNANYGRK